MNQQLAMVLPLPETSAPSRAAGDRGVARARRGQSEWLEKVLKGIAEIPLGVEVTIEEFRSRWFAQGGEAPRSHHAWGAVGQTAARRGLLRFLRLQPAKSVATHGHLIRVYERA